MANQKKHVTSIIFHYLIIAIVAVSISLADNNNQCLEWADTGECEKNPGYMLKHCPESCQRLSEVVSEQQARVRDLDGNFYNLKANDIDSNSMDFDDFRDSVVVITNVASQCGYTESHYAGLVKLYSSLSSATDKVQILAFPCNQFGNQEPGSSDDIKDFARSKGVEFTMMEKIYVNGPNTSLVYLFLKQYGGVSNIAWNFGTYFVVDTNGDITSHSGIEPMDLQQNIFELLGKEEL
mmetsp:Transcript_4439/g.5145  ORF Transcript_4439/g.5145 Transcript_4439/m.5145 type:complete len:237 (+) Transcript_4439:142-852(+)